jgi:hypothetical protein
MCYVNITFFCNVITHYVFFLVFKLLKLTDYHIKNSIWYTMKVLKKMKLVYTSTTNTIFRTQINDQLF